MDINIQARQTENIIGAQYNPPSGYESDRITVGMVTPSSSNGDEPHLSWFEENKQLVAIGGGAVAGLFLMSILKPRY